MPTSPLPNSAVSLLPPPEDIVVVAVELLSLSLPQAARKAASAVDPPPTARNLRLDWGPASCLMSAIAWSPPGRLPALPYGGGVPGGSESPGCFELHQLLPPAEVEVDAVREGGGRDAGGGAVDAGVDHLGAERLGAGDRALRLGRAGGSRVPARRIRGDRAAALHPRSAAADARVATPGRLAAQHLGRRG